MWEVLVIKKEELIRYKAGLAALMLSSGMLLSGCANKFELTVDEERNLVAEDDSYIHNDFLKKYYVVEAKSKITDESNIYITRRKVATSLNFEYIDVFTNISLFQSVDNTSFEVIKETPLLDYLISLNLVKGAYSYEDMQNIYEEIKSIYEFEDEKELVK